MFQTNLKIIMDCEYAQQITQMLSQSDDGYKNFPWKPPYSLRVPIIIQFVSKDLFRRANNNNIVLQSNKLFRNLKVYYNNGEYLIIGLII